MKAMQYKSFGGPEVIEQIELPIPSVNGEMDILIEVKAASINPVDIKIRNGLMQQIRPVELPFIPGSDAAGLVIAVGNGVSRFKPGDEVVAITMKNAYADYVVAQEPFVFEKPAHQTFHEAASVAVNIAAAQSVLFNEGLLENGQRVMIQGAAGAAGAAMLQMAKAAGAYVIATASGAGLQLVKDLGADEVIDYTAQDVRAVIRDIDLVADTAGGESQSKLFEILRPGGKLLSIAAPPSTELAQRFNVKARFVVSDLTAHNLTRGLALINAGLFKAIVAKTFLLTDAAKAQQFLSAGGVNGKVVLVTK